MRYLTLLLLGFAGAATSAGQTSPPNTQPICDLFKDLESHADKVVTVRGLLYQGSEIFALGGHCESRFVTRYSPMPTLPGVPEVISEYVWPTAINLAGSTDYQRKEKPVPYETDTQSIKSTLDYVSQQRAKLQKPENAGRDNSAKDLDVYVTITGTLRMKTHYDIGPLPNGRTIGSGYGHLSMYPAELVIKTMGDPAVQ